MIVHNNIFIINACLPLTQPIYVGHEDAQFNRIGYSLWQLYTYSLNVHGLEMAVLSTAKEEREGYVHWRESKAPAIAYQLNHPGWGCVWGEVFPVKSIQLNTGCHCVTCIFIRETMQFF